MLILPPLQLSGKSAQYESTSSEALSGMLVSCTTSGLCHTRSGWNIVSAGGEVSLADQGHVGVAVGGESERLPGPYVVEGGHLRVDHGEVLAGADVLDGAHAVGFAQRQNGVGVAGDHQVDVAGGDSLGGDARIGYGIDLDAIEISVDAVGGPVVRVLTSTVTSSWVRLSTMNGPVPTGFWLRPSSSAAAASHSEDVTMPSWLVMVCGKWA